MTSLNEWCRRDLPLATALCAVAAFAVIVLA